MGDADPHQGVTREARIIDAFVHLADTLVDDYDVIEFLHFLTARCLDLADVDEASVMLAAPTGHLQAVASSSERSRLLELFELQNRDGPCLDAFRSGAVVVAADLALVQHRWPTFSTRALELGFAAAHSVPLRLRDTIIGALNLVKVDRGTLSERDARLVRALADIATIGVLQERTVTHLATEASGLQHALTSRIRIEQAKGILAERTGSTVDDAFDRLRRYARRAGLRLTDVAEAVVARRLEIADTPAEG